MDLSNLNNPNPEENPQNTQLNQAQNIQQNGDQQVEAIVEYKSEGTKLAVMLGNIVKNKKVIIFFCILILLIIIAAVVSRLQPTYRPPQETDIDVTPTNVTNQTPVPENWTELNNRQYEFIFIYPNEAQLIEKNPFSLEPSSYTVVYSRFPNNDPEVNEFTLDEGYLFRVIVNKLETTELPADLSELKQTVFYTQCPEGVTMSGVRNIKISGFDAATFDVRECNGTYRHTYVSRNKRIFELTEYYIGDIGYREKYAATVDEIFKSFDITNRSEAKPSASWVEYKNLDAGFSFRHPSFDAKCCTVEGPIPVAGQNEDNIEKIITFGRPGTPRDSIKPFDGFAVYLVNNIPFDTFDQYVEAEREALINNYKVLIGKTPVGTTKQAIVGDKVGVFFEDLAWWGDVILVDYGDKNVLVISKTEALEGSFDTEFGELLNTFRFGVFQ